MSAANDGANADSRIAAVARRLIFITVLMVRPVTGTSSAASVPNSTPPVDGFNRQPHSAPISPALLCGANQTRDGPQETWQWSSRSWLSGPQPAEPPADRWRAPRAARAGNALMSTCTRPVMTNVAESSIFVGRILSLSHRKSRIQIRAHDLAARRARVVQEFLPSREQGRRECRTLGASVAACAVKISTRVSHHGHTGITRHSPRNGFNGFLRALLGDRAFLPPSSAKLLSPT
jgi:hypothetical protein